MKYLFLTAELIVFFLLLGFYNQHTALLPQPSKLYSTSLPFRLQTNALLQGKLSLSPHPYGIRFDFDYTELGMQQNWGLGVPLLRLPFEWIAKISGIEYFPDRLTLLFYLTLTMVLMNLALRMVLSCAGLIADSLEGFFLRWGLIGWFLLSPPMSGLIQYRFVVYEEGVFYGCIYSGLLLALFWIYMQRAQDRIFILLCLASGFAWMIRPTLIFYGIVTAVLAMVYAYQDLKKIRLIAWGAICFSAGIVVNLVFNYLRFGSMLEFCYSAHVSRPTEDYGLKFGFPYHHEPFLKATKELMEALFLNHGYESHQYYRFREYYFFAFNASHLVIMAVGIVFLIFMMCPGSLSKKYLGRINKPCFKVIFFSLIWGIICFGLHFIFYLHARGISSRYLSDFSTAYYAMLIAFILIGLSLMKAHYSWIKTRNFLLVFILGLSVLFYLNNKDFFKYESSKSDIGTKQDVSNGVDSFNRSLLFNPRLPETFYCGRPYKSLKRDYQFAGWNVSGDCLVSDDTSVFMPTKKCLTINYTVLGHEDSLNVRAMRGITYLKLEEGQSLEEKVPSVPWSKVITQRFCSERFIPHTIALYSIGWIKSDLVKSMNETLPVKLNWVKVDENKN